MSWNGSGVYVPPAGQPVASGTVIQSSVFNTYVTDVGNTFNNSLPRDGQASMTGQLKIVDGTATIPGLTFNSDAATGIYRSGVGTLNITVSGSQQLGFTTTGAQFTGTLGVTGNTTLSGTLGVTGALTANTFASAGATLTGGTINNMPIGATTPSTGSFTTLNSSGTATLNVLNITGSIAVNGGTINNTSIGATTPSTGSFTTLNSSGTATIGGNVGIGTALGSIRLNVLTSNVAGGDGLRVQNPNTNGYYTLFQNGSTGSAAGWADSTTLESVPASTGGLILSAYSNNIIFQTGNRVERMRIDANGNVGIGVSSMGQRRLIIGGAQYPDTVIKSNVASGSTGASTLYFGNSATDTAGYVNYDHGGNFMSFATVSGERMRIDANGNVGLGVTPSAWSSIKVIEGNGGALGFNVGVTTYLTQNLYYNGSSWIYKNAGPGSLYVQGAGNHGWFGQTTGSAGATASLVQTMLLDNSSRLVVGGSTATGQITAITTTSNGAGTPGWTSGNVVVGPAAGSTTGAAIGIGYNTTLDQAEIIALQPSVAWKPLAQYANSFKWIFSSTTLMSLSNAGALGVYGSVSATNYVASSTESFRTVQDSGFISFYNSGNTTRTGYIQGNTGTSLIIAAENSAALNLNSTTSSLNLQTNSTTRLQISNAGVITDGAGNELGYKGLPQNFQTSAYTLAATDRGKHVYIGSSVNVTVPANVFNVGDVITVVNGTGGSITLVQGTSTALYQAGTANTGNRTILVHGICTLLCTGGNGFFVSGNIT